MSGDERTLSGRKRAAIIDAAACEFRDAGFASTSMDRIAQRARVSKRTVYNHFTSKEALFQAIIDLLVEQMHGATDVPFDPGADVAVQLRDLALRELDILADENNLGLSRAMIGEAIRSPELARRAWAEIASREAGITKWIRAAARHGRLVVDDAVLAGEQFIALIKAVAFWPQLIGGVQPPTRRERRKLADATVSIFLAKYLARSRSAPHSPGSSPEGS